MKVTVEVDDYTVGYLEKTFPDDRGIVQAATQNIIDRYFHPEYMDEEKLSA